jgi:hypothetical protein
MTGKWCYVKDFVRNETICGIKGKLVRCPRIKSHYEFGITPPTNPSTPRDERVIFDKGKVLTVDAQFLTVRC